MAKLTLRVDYKVWDYLKKKFKTKTDQATIEHLIRQYQTVEANYFMVKYELNKLKRSKK